MPPATTLGLIPEAAEVDLQARNCVAPIHRVVTRLMHQFRNAQEEDHTCLFSTYLGSCPLW